MPSTDEILQQLAEVASGWRVLALAWHAYFGVIAIGLAVGARPSRRVAGLLLAIPLSSVSLLAWSVGNPFNGAVFALAAVALLGLALMLSSTPIVIAPRWIRTTGVLIAGFGWTYPHFLGGAASPVEYLYAAPTGLIPCPTLAMLVGLTLVVDCLGSRVWSASIAALGVAYGTIGGAMLGVAIDWLLALGAFALLAAAWQHPAFERS